MAGLILEGGTLRPIFSAGVMDALLDNDIMFPYCIGVSAGATNAVSYISKQKRRNLDVVIKYRNDKRYLGLGNFLKCKSIFGLDFVFDEIPNSLVPFDMDTYQSYSGKFLVGLTNANTGKTEYVDGKDLDDKCTILRATCAIPIFFPVIKYKNIPYYDGGICDPIPIKKSISDGNGKNLIVLTRPKSYKKTLTKKNIFAAKILSRKFPNLKEHFLTRHNLYNDTVKYCEELESQGKALILRPSEEISPESFEKDTNKLQATYDYGYKLATENIDKIKQLLI